MQKTPKYHFILVEDSRLDSFIGKVVIEGLGDTCLSFTSFLDPNEALEYMHTCPIREERTIVFLDIQMPLMSGFEFMDRYEETLNDAQKAQFNINILSSSINEKDIVKANSYQSINLFLNKPLKKEMVVSVVVNVSDRFL